MEKRTISSIADLNPIGSDDRHTRVCDQAPLRWKFPFHCRSPGAGTDTVDETTRFRWPFAIALRMFATAGCRFSSASAKRQLKLDRSRARGSRYRWRASARKAFFPIAKFQMLWVVALRSTARPASGPGAHPPSPTWDARRRMGLRPVHCRQDNVL